MGEAGLIAGGDKEGRLLGDALTIGLYGRDCGLQTVDGSLAARVGPAVRLAQGEEAVGPLNGRLW